MTKRTNKQKNEKMEPTLTEEDRNLKKSFFNNPLPIIIALIIVCVVQLYFLFNINSKNAIYSGELNKEDVQIINLHLFTNNDMNYFYASPALYLGEDYKIYNFELGYYIEKGKGEYLSFATKSRELDSASSLKEIVEEMSGWNFFEPSIQDYFFSDEVLNNLDEMHFIIKASTKKGSTDADIVIDYPIDLNKLTK